MTFSDTGRIRQFPRRDTSARLRPMRPATNQDNAKITAGAVAAVVATGMLFVIALALLLAM